MDTDALRYERACAIERLEFAPLGQTPEQDAARKKRNETRLGMAELADMYLKQAEQRRRVDNEQ